MGARHSLYQHNRRALVTVQTCGERNARPYLEKARVEICLRVQLPPQHASLTFGYVQSFGSRFLAAAFSRAVKSSLCCGFSSGETLPMEIGVAEVATNPRPFSRFDLLSK